MILLICRLMGSKGATMSWILFLSIFIQSKPFKSFNTNLKYQKAVTYRSINFLPSSHRVIHQMIQFNQFPSFRAWYVDEDMSKIEETYVKLLIRLQIAPRRRLTSVQAVLERSHYSASSGTVKNSKQRSHYDDVWLKFSTALRGAVCSRMMFDWRLNCNSYK